MDRHTLRCCWQTQNDLKTDFKMFRTPFMDSYCTDDVSETALIKITLESLQPKACFYIHCRICEKVPEGHRRKRGQRERALHSFSSPISMCLLNNALISGLAVNSPVIKMCKVNVAALDGWEVQASCLFALTDIFPLQWKLRQPLSINVSSVFQSRAEDRVSLNHRQCFSKTTYKLL